MNTIWSTYVQSIGTLYDSRVLRFSDIFKSKYIDIFNFKDNAQILEVGCGPGALAESLSRWYPCAKIYGIDRDSNFIEYAKKKLHLKLYFPKVTLRIYLIKMILLMQQFQIQLQNI